MSDNKRMANMRADMRQRLRSWLTPQQRTVGGYPSGSKPVDQIKPPPASITVRQSDITDQPKTRGREFQDDERSEW